MTNEESAAKAMSADTGEIALDGGEGTIGPGLTLPVLRASPLGAAAKSRGKGTLALGRHAIGGQVFLVTLRFDGDRLASVELYSPDAEPLTWDTWSEEKELARKARHDAWLEEQLGANFLVRPWGRVSSVFDRRGGAASIFVTYEPRA